MSAHYELVIHPVSFPCRGNGDHNFANLSTAPDENEVYLSCNQCGAMVKVIWPPIKIDSDAFMAGLEK